MKDWISLVWTDVKTKMSSQVPWHGIKDRSCLLTFFLTFDIASKCYNYTQIENDDGLVPMREPQCRHTKTFQSNMNSLLYDYIIILCACLATKFHTQYNITHWKCIHTNEFWHTEEKCSWCYQFHTCVKTGNCVFFR